MAQPEGIMARTLSEFYDSEEESVSPNSEDRFVVIKPKIDGVPIGCLRITAQPIITAPPESLLASKPERGIEASLAAAAAEPDHRVKASVAAPEPQPQLEHRVEIRIEQKKDISPADDEDHKAIAIDLGPLPQKAPKPKSPIIVPNSAECLAASPDPEMPQQIESTSRDITNYGGSIISSIGNFVYNMLTGVYDFFKDLIYGTPTVARTPSLSEDFATIHRADPYAEIPNSRSHNRRCGWLRSVLLPWPNSTRNNELYPTHKSPTRSPKYHLP